MHLRPGKALQMLQPLAHDKTGRLRHKTAEAWQLTAAVP